jgi:histidinol-phosphate phosphatase family protein
MAVSPTARARALATANAAATAQKRTYAERIRRIQGVVSPPLTNAELSLGLELDEREVGRFVSESPRMATARPHAELRALLDALLAGELALAVRSAAPGARREVLVLEHVEARRLDRTWSVPIGGDDLRDAELDDDDLWSLGAARLQRIPPRPRRLLGQPVHPIVIGTLRLGTEGRPDEATALAVLHAALDAGAQVIDTADSYGLDDTDLGYAERLVARLGRPVTVVTKVGLARPGGRWIPAGSPSHIRAAVEASLRNLGGDALDLVLLHAVDPRVPLADSVGALARLREEGAIRAVGLSNVDLAQLQAARGIVPIAAVQNEVSRYAPDLALVGACEELGIPVMAHRPLGGHARKGQADGAIAEVARRLSVSPAQVSLAWLLAAAPNLLPVVGPTSPAHATDAVAAATLPLDATALAALDRGFPPRVLGDAVVLIAGPPAAGKTSRVHAYVERGFARLNRDELGGRLDDLVPLLAAGLATGQRRQVLDNTYPTRESRRPVIEAARAAGVPARVVLVDTPLPEALYNAALRLYRRHGKLLGPEEMARSLEVNDIPPRAVFRYFQTVQSPELSEGLAAIERVPFERAPSGSNRAILLDIDGTVRTTPTGAPYPRHPDEVVLLPGRAEKLRALFAEGWMLLGVSNQSGVARGDVDDATVEACFRRTEELLGVPLPVRYCPHASGEIRCWCRKPMPGLGVAWIEDRALDRTRCLVVGDMDSDRELAVNLGIPFETPERFFS